MKFFYFSFLVLIHGWATTTHPIFVRVLLEETPQQKWVISNPGGMIVRDGVTKKEIPLKATFFEFDVTVNSKGLFVNNCKFDRTQLWIEPLREQVCAINGQRYEGRLLIIRAQKKWFLMSVLDLEDYVFSVLKTESWPGWPLEVQKVLAITSRSYVLHRLLAAREQGMHYHIKNTNHHQTYTGLHDCPIIKQAVQETTGIFLSYQGKPILAMFDCCCGGIIPAKTQGLADFTKAPYLRRTYACTHCKDCKIYSWSASYPLHTVKKLLQEHHDAIIHDIKDMKIDHHDKAGLVRQLAIKTKKNTIFVSAQKVAKALKQIKSQCYSLVMQKDKLLVKGQGYGHHLGLCQWGARRMVDKGWQYPDILMYYYPDTDFMRVEHTQQKI